MMLLLQTACCQQRPLCCVRMVARRLGAPATDAGLYICNRPRQTPLALDPDLYMEFWLPHISCLGHLSKDGMQKKMKAFAVGGHHAKMSCVPQVMAVHRDEAKKMVYGLLYGMGTHKLARDLGVCVKSTLY